MKVSKASIKREIDGLGLWGDFVREREVFRKRGFGHMDCWVMARDSVLGALGGSTSPASGVSESSGVPEGLGVVLSQPVVESSTDNVRDIRWVAQNIENVDSVGPTLAPSGSAWNLLRWAVESPVNRRQFWNNIFVRTLPTKSQLDKAQRYQDDGSERLERLEDDVLKAFE